MLTQQWVDKIMADPNDDSPSVIGRPTTRCLGFPSGNGCTQPAGGKWSPHWCPECDKRRVDHISERMKQIEAALGNAVIVSKTVE